MGRVGRLAGRDPRLDASSRVLGGRHRPRRGPSGAVPPAPAGRPTCAAPVRRDGEAGRAHRASTRDDLYPDAHADVCGRSPPPATASASSGNQPVATEAVFRDARTSTLALVASSAIAGRREARPGVLRRPSPIAWACRRRPSPTSATGSTTTSSRRRRPGCSRSSSAAARGRGSRPVATTRRRRTLVDRHARGAAGGAAPAGADGRPRRVRRGRRAFWRPNRPNGDFGGWARRSGVPRRRSARASKSSVIFSLGNISMTVRPSLAARTKSSPPERIWASAGIPTVRSRSATDTPLLARLMTSARRSRMPSSDGDARPAGRRRGWPARPG